MPEPLRMTMELPWPLAAGDLVEQEITIRPSDSEERTGEDIVTTRTYRVTRAVKLPDRDGWIRADLMEVRS